jgi:ATP-dependent DNA ligase
MIVQEVIEDEGEGVIMRKVGSMYEHGRSPNLIKLKVSFIILFVTIGEYVIFRI